MTDKNNPSNPAGTPVNPLDKREESQKRDSGVIQNIVSTETSKGEKNILEVAPELDSSLLREMEPQKSVALTLLKAFFSILFFASVASFLFFTSQLTSRFEFLASNLGMPSAIIELSTVNNEVIRLQTDINYYRYLQIKSFLDQFSFYGDSFIRNYDIANSPTASGIERERARNRLVEIKDDLASVFLPARELIANPIHVPIVDANYSEDDQLITFFQERLISKLRTSARNSSDNRKYMNTIDLVGNKDLRTLLIQTDFDALSDAQLYNLINKINSLIVNEMSTIQRINRRRIKWSDVINEIDLRTKAVDAYYSRDFFDTVGGVRYTSFDLDSPNRRISITGETKTINTATFTMIANLIDELNSSEMFKNGEMRSFSKSGSLADGYTGSLRLSLDLEENLIINE